MDIELEKLNKLGAQKVAEDTHIPVVHIKALLTGTFNSFSRIQFLGFISILEREYGDKLTSTKNKGIEYFDEIDAQNIDDGLLVAPKRAKKKSASYIFIILFLFVVGLLSTLSVFEEKTLSEHKIDNSKIEKIHKNIELEKSLNPIELNTTSLDNNSTLEDANATSTENIIETPVLVEKSFTIVTPSKAWIGYIDLQTGEKFQTIFTKTFELDPKRDWLIIFGHPYVDMSVNGTLIDFGQRKNIRFVYENGSLITIDSAKYQELNKGSEW